MGARVFALAWLLLMTSAACVGSDPAGVGVGAGGGGDPSTGSDAGGDASSATNPGAGDADATPAAATPLRVQVVRNPAAQGHPAYGTRVEIDGLVVTGIKSAGMTHGFFAQDPASASWGGIYVFVGYATVGVNVGDVVRVSGVYTVFRGFDQIESWNGGSVTTTGTASVPEPLAVSVADIGIDGPRAKELQSARLVVSAVTTSQATSGIDFRVTAKAGGGAVLAVTSYVANDVGTPPFTSTVGQSYATIRGFGYASGASDQTSFAKLAPQSAADLVLE